MFLLYSVLLTSPGGGLDVELFRIPGSFLGVDTLVFSCICVS